MEYKEHTKRMFLLNETTVDELSTLLAYWLSVQFDVRKDDRVIMRGNLNMSKSFRFHYFSLEDSKGEVIANRPMTVGEAKEYLSSLLQSSRQAGEVVYFRLK